MVARSHTSRGVAMHRFFITLAFAGLGVGGVAAGGEAAKDEWNRFQGTWQLASEVQDGKDQPDEYVKSIRMFILPDGKWRVEKGGQFLFQGTGRLDPSKSPKQADYTLAGDDENKGKVVRAIYELEGD